MKQFNHQKQIQKNGNLLFIPIHGKTEELKTDLPYPLLMFFKKKYAKDIQYHKSKGNLIIQSLYVKSKPIKIIETDTYSNYLREN